MPKLIEADWTTQDRLQVFKTGWLPVAYQAIYRFVERLSPEDLGRSYA